MDDQISRQKVLEYLNCIIVNGGRFNGKGVFTRIFSDFVEYVKTLPSAQPEVTEEAKWIPCKVRKPEKSGQYLVTKRQKTGQIIRATAHYSTDFDEWSGSGSFKDVLAWMPLPKPYKEDSDGRND